MRINKFYHEKLRPYLYSDFYTDEQIMALPWFYYTWLDMSYTLMAWQLEEKDAEDVAEASQFRSGCYLDIY